MIKIKNNNLHLKVNFKVVLEYLKACRYWLAALLIILFLLGYAADVLQDFWLSFWSNEVESNPEEALKKKYQRLGVYALLGFVKSIF